MAPTCHICVISGVRTCDPEEAELKCEVCGFCAAEKKRNEEKQS
jgi:hypothetical protein